MPHVLSSHRFLHTMPKPMCTEKPLFWMTSNDLYKPKYFWMIHYNDLFIFKIHAPFLWVVDFLCLTVGSTNPYTFTAFYRWGLCLTIISRFFTPSGDLSLLADTRHIFSISCNRATLLDVVPFIEPTQSNTKRNVDLPTMHSHSTQCDAPVHIQCKMPLHASSCYMYNTQQGTIYKPYFMPSTMDNYIESI